jgi:triosephosphate isomerase
MSMPSNNKKKIFIGNWKMNAFPVADVTKRISAISKAASPKAEVVICPPHVYLSALIKKPASVSIGAQDVFHEEKGSYTSQVSIDMLKNLGVSHVIIGHSERRKMGETDDMVNKKVLLALKAKITPIICIGETERDEEGNYLGLIKNQIEIALRDVTKNQLRSIVIAYEPVWAIGASQAMNAHDVHQMVLFIKKALLDMYKLKTMSSTPVLYGGSVDPTNAHGILTEGEADGLLVGRQSLEAASFIEIIRAL